jgi:RNA polymerase sigma factor (sigma-70 family)
MHAQPPASSVPAANGAVNATASAAAKAAASDAAHAVIDVAVDAAETAFVENLPLIRAVIRATCRRYRVAPCDEADFESSVLLKLIDHDYAVFRQFRGDGGGRDGRTLRAFLHAVISRCLLDRRNREWGRWRPSCRARKLGSAAVYLEDLIYRRQTPVHEAVAIVSNHPHWTLSSTSVRGLYAQLPPRPPRRPRGEPLSETIERIAHASDAQSARSARKDDAANVREALAAALRRLDSGERRLLRLRFRNGLTIQQIAVQTGVEARVLYRRLPVVLTRLRHELQSQRLDGRQVAALLGHLGDELDSLLARTWKEQAVRSLPS